MSAPIQDELAAAARRLEALAGKVAELRERLRPPAPGQAAPLFADRTGGALNEVDHADLDRRGQRTP